MKNSGQWSVVSGQWFVLHRLETCDVTQKPIQHGQLTTDD